MTLPRVALVTCALQPALYGEESQLPPLIAARGIDVAVVNWDDPAVDWASFDVALVRSTWDYFERYDEFCAWLDRVSPLTAIHNSPTLMRWNSDKRYLIELEARGVRIVPTVLCERGQSISLATVARERGWTRLVLKPAVSGGAYRTHLIDDVTTGQPILDELLRHGAALIQPFFPEIKAQGEVSFFFFADVLSHAVDTRTGGDDYRVQTQFGGTAMAIDPAPLLPQVRAVLDALPERPTYARIDGVVRGDDFYLMEAELVEPYLYLCAAAPQATTAYVDLVELVCRR